MKTQNIPFLNEAQKQILIDKGISVVYSKLILDMIKSAIETPGNKIYYMREVKMARPIDNFYNISVILSALGFKFTHGNDAPRGGQLGRYILIENPEQAEAESWRLLTIKK